MATNARKSQNSQQSSSSESVVHSITNAQPSLSQDQSTRARRYFISMMIRTFCFVLAVLLPNPYRWIALIGAMTLPYIAVVVANAGRETILGSMRRADDSRAIAGSDPH